MPNASLNLASRYDLFINHSGKDVKESVASLNFHNLNNKGAKVLFDKNSIPVGMKIPKSIVRGIRTASDHVAIFSPNYAESEWCLRELHLMLKTGAPIVPVFCGVQPSELRMKDKDGVYARAFKMHKQSGKSKSRKLKKWKKALRKVSKIKGFIFGGDQGELLERIALSVIQYIDMVKPQQKHVTSQLEETIGGWTIFLYRL